MKFATYISILLVSAAAAGCLRDRHEGCAEGDGQIVIQIRMPESFASRSATRSLTEVQEVDINRLDILVFRDSGGSETFMYHVEPTEISVDQNGGLPVKYFTAKLQTSEHSEKQRLVLIANIPEAVSGVFDFITEGMSKEEVLSNFVFPTQYKWPFACLPMWGESAVSVLVTPSTNGSAFGSIKMLYSMARIDVGLNINEARTEFQGLENYTLREIVLSGVSKDTYIAPDKNNLDAGGVPFCPTVPMTYDLTRYSYDYAAEDIGLPYFGATRLIYAGERANKGKAFGDVSCIVVCLRHYDFPAQDSWYRIDFYDRASEGSEVERLDLLRGHCYTVNIKGVDGPGYPTEEEARNSLTTKLDAEIIVWNEKGIITELGSVYELNVSKSEFSFNGIKRTANDTNNKVEISTNYPGGWRITGIFDVTESGEIPLSEIGWLKVDQMSGEATVPGDPPAEVSIKVDEYDLETPRRGRIYVSAGKWTYTINVEQKLSYISVSPSEVQLTFDHVPVPFAEAKLTMDTDHGWILDRIEYYGNEELDGQDDLAYYDWLSVFDPEILDLDPLKVFKTQYDLVAGDGQLRLSEKAYLRASANPLYTPRRATVIFANEEGVEQSVDVTQGWIDCGTGGITKTRTIGGADYRTHIYGTNIRKIGKSMEAIGYFKAMGEPWQTNAIEYINALPDKYAVSCFMVDNLDDGNYEFENFMGNPTTTVEYPRGPYYTLEQSRTACPEGWRLPNGLDANNINIPSEALLNYGLHYFTPDYLLWATPETYTGYLYYYSYPQPPYLSGWNVGTLGYYWGGPSDEYDEVFCIEAHTETRSLAGTYISFYSQYQNPDIFYLRPVRCVEDISPYNYPVHY